MAVNGLRFLGVRGFVDAKKVAEFETSFFLCLFLQVKIWLSVAQSRALKKRIDVH